jgi:predicted secreted protein
MASFAGETMILHLGNGGAPESFSPIQGLIATGFILQRSPADSTHAASGVWRQWLEKAGVQAVEIQAEGRFSNSAAEATLRQDAFSGSLRNYRLIFGNGDYLQARCTLTRYQRRGEMQADDHYTLTLQSSGIVSYSVRL